MDRCDAVCSSSNGHGRIGPVSTMIDFDNIADAQKLAQAIINTIQSRLSCWTIGFACWRPVVFFYETFKVDPMQTGAACFSRWMATNGIFPHLRESS